MAAIIGLSVRQKVAGGAAIVFQNGIALSSQSVNDPTLILSAAGPTCLGNADAAFFFVVGALETREDGKKTKKKRSGTRNRIVAAGLTEMLETASTNASKCFLGNRLTMFVTHLRFPVLFSVV